MNGMSRRTFLRSAGAAAALTAASAERVLGANDRINVGVIGCGGRGRYVTWGLLENRAHLAYLCDLHPGRRESCGHFLNKNRDGKLPPPKMTAEMRAIFDDKDVDAVVVATPDHWHARSTILACQAGKDVYVEKPHSHTIWESAQMVAAARKHKRIVQVGTQNRSGPYNHKALEYVRGGKLGKISFVKVYNLKPGRAFKLGQPGKCPEGLNWDTWVGKSPARPYHQRILHGGWQSFWDFSGGDMAGDGIHQIDLALMLMGDPAPPKSVRGVGGRIAHKGDDAEVPDVQVVNWDYGSFIMTCEETQYPRYMLKTAGTIRRNDVLPNWSHNATRIELYGSERMMTVGRHGGGWIVQQSGGKVVEKVFGRPCDDPHYKNFLDCIRTRKAPNADVALAHKSVLALHMANLAHRVGNVGMNYDAQAGTFDNAAANQLVKGTYRKGFEVPEIA